MVAVKDTAYYDTLGVRPDASPTSIRQAYYRAALESHPDKHPGDDRAVYEARFKAAAEAYSVLSDDTKRAVYDRHGRDGVQQEADEDEARAMFRRTFAGGDAFADIVGESVLVDMLSEVMKSAESANRDDAKPAADPLSLVMSEEALARRQERIALLKSKFCAKTEPFTSGKMSETEFVDKLRREARTMREEVNGGRLLALIGHVYSVKAGRCLEGGRLKGLWMGWKEHKHAWKTKLELLKAFGEANREGKRREDAQRRGEPLTADPIADEELFKKLVWSGSRVDIESILRDVCHALLHDKTADPHTIHSRALAMGIIGRVYKEFGEAI